MHHLVNCWKVFNYEPERFFVLFFQGNLSVEIGYVHIQELSSVAFDDLSGDSMGTSGETLNALGGSASVTRYNQAKRRLISLRLAVLKWLPMI